MPGRMVTPTREQQAHSGARFASQVRHDRGVDATMMPKLVLI